MPKTGLKGRMVLGGDITGFDNFCVLSRQAIAAASSEETMSGAFVFAARRSDSFYSGICHRIRDGRADGNAF